MCLVSFDIFEAVPVCFTCSVTPVIVTSLRNKNEQIYHGIQSTAALTCALSSSVALSQWQSVSLAWRGLESAHRYWPHMHEISALASSAASTSSAEKLEAETWNQVEKQQITVRRCEALGIIALQHLASGLCSSCLFVQFWKISNVVMQFEIHVSI